MKFFQVAEVGRKPCGPLFETRMGATAEIAMLKRDDRRYADDARNEAGIIVKCPEYEIHEVTR